jgi:hypothetical protein
MPSPGITAIRFILIALTLATLAQPRTIHKQMMERRAPPGKTGEDARPSTV